MADGLHRSHDTLIYINIDTDNFAIVPEGITFKVFDDNANTDLTAGLIIEQDGTGDALAHFVLTGAQTFTMGLDNNVSNGFAIHPGDSLVANPAFFINPNNNRVGIGTSTPDAELDVSNTAGGSEICVIGAAGDIRISSSILGVPLIRADKTSGVVNFDIRARPLDGTSNANYRFGINSGSTGRNAITLFEPDGSTAQTRITSSDDDTVFNINPGGMFGIGNTSPTALLDVLSTLADTTSVFALETTGTNGARAEVFVGDQDPNVAITGAGGYEYIRPNGDLSGRYLSLEPTTGTEWFKYSLNPPTVIEINSEAQFEALATIGVIPVIGDTTIDFKVDVTTASRFDVTGGTLHLTGGGRSGTTLAYSGTATFITLTGANLRVLGMRGIQGTSTGTFISQTGSSSARLRLTRLLNWDFLGSSTEANNFILADVAILNWGEGFTFTNTNVVSMIEVNAPSSGSTTLINYIATQTDVVPTLTLDNFNRLETGRTLVNIDPRTVDTANITITRCPVSPGVLFEVGTDPDVVYSAVSGITPATATLTQMQDNLSGGTIVSAAGHSFFEDQVITQSGTTNYNDTYRIFNVVASVSYEIREPFAGDDATGSADSDLIEFAVPVSHGIVAGDNIKVVNSNYYNAFYPVLTATATEIEVNGIFISGSGTDTGTIERDVSLDQTDPRVLARLNRGFSDSLALAYGSVNSNTATTTITDGTYAAIDVTGFSLDPDSERFRLVDPDENIWQYIGIEPFKGFLTGLIAATKSGSTENYRFAVSVGGVVPTFATAVYTPMEVKTSKVVVPLELNVSLVQNDLFQIMAAGDGSGDDIILTDLVHGVK